MTETRKIRNLTAVILAGGMARRMDGQDKGLIDLHGKPMIEYIVETLKPQVGNILINANRNLAQYQRYGYPVIKDAMGDYFGPLAGMASGLQACNSDRILVVPCDSPFIPPVLADRLNTAQIEDQTDISVANDGERMQPVFAILRTTLLSSLLAYLDAGGRKTDTWYKQQNMSLVDFSDWTNAFMNVNTPEEKLAAEQIITRE